MQVSRKLECDWIDNKHINNASTKTSTSIAGHVAGGVVTAKVSDTRGDSRVTEQER